MIIFSGVGLNRDNAIGKVLKYGTGCAYIKAQKEETQAFIDKFHQVRAEAIRQVEELYNNIIQQDGEDEAEIFLSHQLLLKDDILVEAVENKIKSGLCLIESLNETMKEYVSMFEKMESEVFTSKSHDIMDIFMRMIDITKGTMLPDLQPEDDFILCCENLLPSYLYKFNNDHLKGIVVKNGMTTSHGIILAKKKNIPVVVDVKEYEQICNNDKILINGSTGKIIFINKNGRVF